MKYTKHETIQVQHVVVDLDEGDYVILDLPNGKSIFFSYSVGRRSLDLKVVREGERFDKEPFLRVTTDQMFRLQDAADAGKFDYIRLTIPGAYYEEVKKRLEGLPIIV